MSKALWTSYVERPTSGPHDLTIISPPRSRAPQQRRNAHTFAKRFLKDILLRVCWQCKMTFGVGFRNWWEFLPTARCRSGRWSHPSEDLKWYSGSFVRPSERPQRWSKFTLWRSNEQNELSASNYNGKFRSWAWGYNFRILKPNLTPYPIGIRQSRSDESLVDIGLSYTTTLLTENEAIEVEIG